MVDTIRIPPSGPVLAVVSSLDFNITYDEFLDSYANASSRKSFRKFARNPDVDSANPEDIWNGGGLYPGLLQTPERLRLVGTNAADAPGGAGAQSVIIQPHDTDFNWLDTSTTQIELPTPGAGSGALTDASYIRNTRAFALASGTYAGSSSGAATGSNLGDITIQTESGIVLGTLLAGFGTTQLSTFTVPNGWDLYLEEILISVGSSQAASLRFFIRQNADIVSSPFSARRNILNLDGAIGSVPIPINYQIKIPALSDVWWNADVGANNTPVSVTYWGLLLQRPS